MSFPWERRLAVIKAKEEKAERAKLEREAAATAQAIYSQPLATVPSSAPTLPDQTDYSAGLCFGRMPLFTLAQLEAEREKVVINTTPIQNSGSVWWFTETAKITPEQWRALNAAQTTRDMRRLVDAMTIGGATNAKPEPSSDGAT